MMLKTRIEKEKIIISIDYIISSGDVNTIIKILKKNRIKVVVIDLLNKMPLSGDIQSIIKLYNKAKEGRLFEIRAGSAAVQLLKSVGLERVFKIVCSDNFTVV